MKVRRFKQKNRTFKIEDTTGEPENKVGVSNKYKEEKEEFRRLKREKDKEKTDLKQIRKENKKQRNLKSARLIVRNLPFKSSETSIKEYFSKIGAVSEVNVLKKGDKLVGCCFVQYENKASAAKAISNLSGKPFMGRPIVVDWALPKDKFNKSSTKEVGLNKSNVEIKMEHDSTESDVEITTTKHEGSKKLKTEDNDTEDSENDEDNVSEEELETDNDGPDSDNEGSIEVHNKNQIQEIPGGKGKNKKFHFQYDPKDVSDGRTVFLKNVPFSATDDDLLKCAKEIGDVIYAVICVDPLTEHSKGTGFVKFNDKSVVNDLILGKTKLTLKGIKLDAFMALKKNQLQDMKEHKGPKDNRNLYLLREGIILAGTPAAEGVSEGDMNKRLQLEHWKTQTLKNLNKFVSNNRLVVHNVPPFYDDNRLKQVFKDNSPKGAVITEARIMRNLKDIDENGRGRSKGFAFVTFTKHEHALEALRKINNNPSIFKDTKRPIVGFSIENRVALRQKEARKAKSLNPPKKPVIESEKSGKSAQKNNKGTFSKVEGEDLPPYVGYIAKPGAKKMRSRKELSTQASLHHNAVIDSKMAKKRKHNFGKQFKNRKNLKKKM